MNVMVIEDEPIIRYALVKMIKNLGVKGFQPHLVTEAAYAEVAVDDLQKTNYDIVFVDIEGGEMNGLDLIEQWRDKRPDTSWIIVSGYDRFEYAQRAILYGVQEYLLKPITKDKLSQSVCRCMQQMQKQNYNYIKPDKIEQFILRLEEAIWNVNEAFVRSLVYQWDKKTAQQYLSINYYNDVMNYVLEELIHRLLKRGTSIQPLDDQQIYSINSIYRNQTNQLFINVCLQLIEKIKAIRKGNEKDPIEMAKQYILEHIDKDLSLEDVANKLGFNPSYFSQIFKQKTGQTFVKYRTTLRMEKAKEILLRHDVRIIDIPFMIGLNDHPHFTKTFKEYTGYTPSGYRRKMGIGQ